MEYKIEIIKRENINDELWNNCIKNATNSLVYGYTSYLDALSSNWDGLVINNYQFVMPLIWRKKWLIKYLYQPAFMQQGGIFGNMQLISHECLQACWQKIKRFAVFAEININHQNNFQLPGKRTKTNFTLSLVQPYEQLFQNTTSDFKKNIKRSQKWQLQYSSTNDYATLVNLYAKQYGHLFPHVTKSDYKHLINLLTKSNSNFTIISRCVYYNQQLVAGVILINDNKRLYNIVNVLVEEGRSKQANHFLYNEILKEFANQLLIFDFEGSDLPGVKHFYQNFQPVYEPYHSFFSFFGF